MGGGREVRPKDWTVAFAVEGDLLFPVQVWVAIWEKPIRNCRRAEWLEKR